MTTNTAPTVSQLRVIAETKRAALARAELNQRNAEAGQREAAAAQRELGFNNVRARNAREAAEAALIRRTAITRRAFAAYESALAALNAAEFAAAEAAPAAPTKDAELAAAVGRAFDRLSADVDAVNARTFAAHVANPFAPGSLAAAVIADAALSGKIERAAADLESAERAAAEARGPGFTPRQSATARRVRDNRAADLANAWNAAAAAAGRAAAAVIAENAGDVGALAALDQAAWENEAAAARAGLFSGPVAEARTRGRCALARRIALAFREALTFAREVNAAVISENTWDAARDYLASRRADSGVLHAVSAFEAALKRAGLRTNGNADAEARAILRVRFNRCAAIYDAAHAGGGCPDWIALTLRDKNTAGAAWHAYAAPGAL
jgi:hypothetical protein